MDASRIFGKSSAGFTPSPAPVRLNARKSRCAGRSRVFSAVFEFSLRHCRRRKKRSSPAKKGRGASRLNARHARKWWPSQRLCNYKFIIIEKRVVVNTSTRGLHPCDASGKQSFDAKTRLGMQTCCSASLAKIFAHICSVTADL